MPPVDGTTNSAPAAGNAAPAGTTAAPAGDTANPASGAASGAPQGTTPAGAAAGTALNGSGQDSVDWTTSLDNEARELVQQKGWKDINTAIKSYRELQSKIGEKTGIEPPGPDADPAAINDFYKKLGRPEKPEEYQFRLPEGVPENAPYDADFALKSKSWFHAAGLSQKQAQVLHDAFVKDMAESATQFHTVVNQQITAAHSEITREWGDENSDTYKRNVEFARRAMRQLDLADAFKDKGFIEPKSGMVTNAKLAKALARVGEAMFAEDRLYSGPDAAFADNPFSDKTFNATRQAQLIKHDPNRARILIRAAGLKPSEYGLSD